MMLTNLLLICFLSALAVAVTSSSLPQKLRPKQNSRRRPPKQNMVTNGSASSQRAYQQQYDSNKKQTHVVPRVPRELQQNELSADTKRDALRARLLENYQRTNFPFDRLWENQTVRAGLPVSLALNFHRIFKVDVATSTADMVVWVRQSWNDPRLQWDANATGIDNLHFWIADGSAGGETSEIWAPDLELWNLELSLKDTLVDTYAVVNADGTVFWSRPGHVQPICKFRGLNKFPFDTLECTMEIGSWSFSGLYLRPQKMGEGYSIGGSETAGESYAEYSLLGIECEELVYPPFPGNQEEDWPVLLYHVTFQRAWEPYARGYLILQIILNLAAFSCFWIPPNVGERMSLAITTLLAAVASQLIIEANLPVASEMTWFATFSVQSLLFTACTLFESAAVIYFHYQVSNDLYPRWYTWIRDKARGQTSKRCRTSVHFSEHVMNKEDLDVSNDSDKEDEPETKDDDPGDVSGMNGSKQRDQSGEVSEISDSDHPASARSLQSSKTAKDFSFRTRQGIKTVLGRDADDFKNYKEMENNIRWQKVASTIDEVSRVVFPVAFAIVVATMFSRVDI